MSKSGGVFQFFGGRVTSRGQCPRGGGVLHTYLEDLGVLSALLEELDHTSFVVMGDWNANLKNPASSLFAKHICWTLAVTTTLGFLHTSCCPVRVIRT